MPLTSDTIAWLVVPAGSTFDSSQPVSLMPNEVNAIFERNATSALHSSKTTVCASVALIFLKLPVYARCVASGASAWPHGASPVSG